LQYSSEQQSLSTRHRSPIGEHAHVLVLAGQEPLQHSLGALQVGLAFDGTPQQVPVPWSQTFEQQSESNWHLSAEPLAMQAQLPFWHAPVPGQHGVLASHGCLLGAQQTFWTTPPEQQSWGFCGSPASPSSRQHVAPLQVVPGQQCASVAGASSGKTTFPVQGFPAKEQHSCWGIVVSQAATLTQLFRLTQFKQQSSSDLQYCPLTEQQTAPPSGKPPQALVQQLTSSLHPGPGWVSRPSPGQTPFSPKNSAHTDVCGSMASQFNPAQQGLLASQY
jgi:hypothetical protein